MAQAIILTGLQGSGKTSYFNAHFSGTHEHVSRDLLRTAEREAALVSECIRSGRSFAIDNTNTTRAVRAPLIQQAKAAGFEVHAYFFDTPVRMAIGAIIGEKIKGPSQFPPFFVRRSIWSVPPSTKASMRSGLLERSRVRVTELNR